MLEREDSKPQKLLRIKFSVPQQAPISRVVFQADLNNPGIIAEL
jgi:hypothetical protein